MLENNLLKVSVDSGSVFGDTLHLFLNVSSVGCGVRLETLLVALKERNRLSLT